MKKRSEKIRILIADDHPVVRLGLRTIINAEADMVVVAETEKGSDVISAFNEGCVDIALIDLKMPGMDGVEVIEAVRRIDKNAKLVVLTTYEGDADIHRALQSGARGYLIKAMPHEILIEAIHQVAAGKLFVPEAVMEQLSRRLPEGEITRREKEVLGLIVKGKSNKEIAAALGISEGTVKCHVNVILFRLGVSGRTEAAFVALQRGIVHL